MPVLPKEPVGISPRVDCVFRALLADPDHADRLVDFLNAVLQRSSPIVTVQLRNPIQPSEFIDDGQIVVDVIATDASGEVFQVEMQSWNHAALKERMLYAWATLYKAQLEKGDKYTELRPVVSIWIMDENTFRGATGFHHRFRVRDDAGVLELSSHLELHVLELDRWRQNPDLTTPAGLLGWMRFFTEAETWREVPRDIDTPRAGERHVCADRLSDQRRTHRSLPVAARPEPSSELHGGVVGAGAGRQGAGARREGAGARQGGAGIGARGQVARTPDRGGDRPRLEVSSRAGRARVTRHPALRRSSP